MSISNTTPVLAVDEKHLVPVSDHLKQMMDIPPSRMFLINKSLKVYLEKNAGAKIFDASQGDGGASLPGTPKPLLERALQLQLEHGTAYDMPFGTDAYRKSVIEQYWKLDSSSGWGPANALGTAGGRDALNKAYQAMLALGHGRQGDLIMVSRVPWISYNWGPYGVGANVLWAPGDPAQGWAYSEDAIRESVKFAESKGRKIAGIVITNPDNPTGMTIAVEKQVSLAKAALEAGVAFVLFDWMYHYVTDESPMDLNSFLKNFTPEERKRIMFLGWHHQIPGRLEHPQLPPYRGRVRAQIHHRTRLTWSHPFVLLARRCHGCLRNGIQRSRQNHHRTDQRQPRCAQETPRRKRTSTYHWQRLLCLHECGRIY
ncbi:MAG: aminotransferase class I/II-fold pyridoxal phosphate-dependent enzyme [Anaerolineales bacterium]|nr:aminotransferase class I/II-fold pyridoxal phosphate-dependent enzyme [Anaerolineales bacterium]